MFYAIDVIAGEARPATVPAVKSPAANHWLNSWLDDSEAINAYITTVPNPDPKPYAKDSSIEKNIERFVFQSSSSSGSKGLISKPVKVCSSSNPSSACISKRPAVRLSAKRPSSS